MQERAQLRRKPSLSERMPQGKKQSPQWGDDPLILLTGKERKEMHTRQMSNGPSFACKCCWQVVSSQTCCPRQLNFVANEREDYAKSIVFARVQGPCMGEEDTCSQPCTRQRQECGHPCDNPCHGDTPCLKTACQTKVTVAHCFLTLQDRPLR